MKTWKWCWYIGVCLLLAVGLSADARMSVVTVGSGGGAAACSTPSGTVMNESFGDDSTACYSGATGDAATCIKTWTVTGDSHTFHHTLQAGSPTGSCTYGLLIDTSSEDNEYIYWDYGSAIAYSTSTDVVFSLYVNGLAIADPSTVDIVALGETTHADFNVTAWVQLRYSSSVMSIRAYSSSSGGYYSTSVPISTATWYTVKLHLDGTANASYFQVTGGESTTCDQTTDCTFTRNDKAKQYLVIGSISGEGAGEEASFELGYVYVDNP